MRTPGASFPGEWFRKRTYHHSRFSDLAALVRAKRGRTVSVCLPTRNEAATVGVVVDGIRRELAQKFPLVDEIVVMDSMSTDGTVEAARTVGAVV